MACTRNTDWLADHSVTLPVEIDFRKRPARFDSHVCLRLGVELALDNDVALRPGSLNIAFHERGRPSEICAAVGVVHPKIKFVIFMNDGRGRRHRFIRRQDRRQFLVFHLDHAGGATGRLFIFSRNNANGLADVANFSARHDSFILDKGTELPALEIRTGQDTDHAGEFLGGAHVVGLNSRVSVGTPEDGAIKHAGTIEVGDVMRPARHLLAAIQPGNALSDHAQGCIPSFARQTASTILL